MRLAEAMPFPARGARGLVGLAAALGLAVLATALGGGCSGPGAGGTGGHAGQGGGGGACPTGPHPSFTLTITAPPGSVPPDTSLDVTWSAGMEPTFLLNDTRTWKTLDQANVVCDVNPAAPLPHYQTLVCTLWTSGATHVVVRAAGYVPYDSMLMPVTSERCGGPVLSGVPIKLQLVKPDAGSP